MDDHRFADAPRLWFGLREEPPAFRAVLRRLTWRGLTIAGILALLGVLLYVGSKILLIANPQLQAADKIIIVAVALGFLTAGWWKCSLSVGRGMMAAGALLAAGASLYADVVRGLISVEYLTFMLLTAVTTTPFRPWQTALLGGGYAGVLVVGGVYGPQWVASSVQPAPILQEAHIVQIAVVSLFVTGISALLYVSRYRQHAARREAERLRDEVTELEAAKSQFYANVSHDLRTPLTLILGPLEDILDGRYGSLPASITDRLAVMRRQAERLQELVNQLLRLSRLDEGRMDLEAQPVDAGPFLRRMQSLFRSMADRQDVDLRVETEGRPAVCADPEALTRIVSNLLSNALEHTPEGGAVRLGARPLSTATDDADRVAIAVRDSGPGLPDDVQAALFDRYVGGDTDASGPLGSGTGIGLALVKELTERHGGRVAVDSEPDFGTEITVTLPRNCRALPDEDLASDADPTPAAVPSGTGNALNAPSSPSAFDDASPPRPEPPEGAPSVLVVDDEAAVRAYLADVLGTRYAIRTAADGEEALRSIREQRPALVVSDVVMPHRDGFELCRALRTDEALRTIPIILLTVQDEDQHVLEGLRRGADAYVGKPFHPEELRQRVENLIDVRRYLRASGPDSDASGRVGDSPAAEPDAAPAETEESAFVQEARAVVEEHLANSSFGVEWLADEVDLSARQLQRRLRDEAGLSAAAFIRAVRLRHAAELLQDGTAETVKAAADAVGYRDASHFSQLFEETHGQPPSEMKS